MFKQTVSVALVSMTILGLSAAVAPASASTGAQDVVGGQVQGPRKLGTREAFHGVQLVAHRPGQVALDPHDPNVIGNTYTAEASDGLGAKRDPFDANVIGSTYTAAIHGVGVIAPDVANPNESGSTYTAAMHGIGVIAPDAANPNEIGSTYTAAIHGIGVVAPDAGNPNESGSTFTA